MWSFVCLCLPPRLLSLWELPSLALGKRGLPRPGGQTLGSGGGGEKRVCLSLLQPAELLRFARGRGFGPCSRSDDTFTVGDGRAEMWRR